MGAIPTNSELQAEPPTKQPSSAQGSNSLPNSGAGPSEAAPAPEPPPVVLAFRDGHREEVKKYTIRGNTVYTGTDYWSTGSWTRESRGRFGYSRNGETQCGPRPDISFALGTGEIVIRF